MTNIKAQWYRLTFSFDNFTVLVGFHVVSEVVSGCSGLWEASLNHLGVGEQDSVERKTGSFDWVFVHICFD